MRLVTYHATIENAGRYQVRHAHQPHENRADRARIVVHGADGDTQVLVNMKVPASGEQGFEPLGVFRFAAGDQPVVTVHAAGGGGAVHTDAIQLVRVRD